MCFHIRAMDLELGMVKLCICKSDFQKGQDIIGVGRSQGQSVFTEKHDSQNSPFMLQDSQ